MQDYGKYQTISFNSYYNENGLTVYHLTNFIVISAY